MKKIIPLSLIILSCAIAPKYPSHLNHSSQKERDKIVKKQTKKMQRKVNRVRKLKNYH